jgi:hypothetical protein
MNVDDIDLARIITLATRDVEKEIDDHLKARSLEEDDLERLRELTNQLLEAESLVVIAQNLTNKIREVEKLQESEDLDEGIKKWFKEIIEKLQGDLDPLLASLQYYKGGSDERRFVREKLMVKHGREILQARPDPSQLVARKEKLKTAVMDEIKTVTDKIKTVTDKINVVIDRELGGDE